MNFNTKISSLVVKEFIFIFSNLKKKKKYILYYFKPKYKDRYEIGIGFKKKKKSKEFLDT